MRGAQRDRLMDVLVEYEKGQKLVNDRAGGHMNLGTLYENLGEDDRAIEAYEAAISVEPTATGPRSHLAALYDRLADASDFQSPSRAMKYREKAAALQRAALELAARDARLLPDNAAIQYRYGLSLYLHRRLDEAETALLAAHELEPKNPQFLLGILLFYKEQREHDKAISLAEKLIELRPQDPMPRQVLKEIRQEMEATRRAGPSTP